MIMAEDGGNRWKFILDGRSQSWSSWIIASILIAALCFSGSPAYSQTFTNDWSLEFKVPALVSALRKLATASRDHLPSQVETITQGIESSNWLLAESAKANVSTRLQIARAYRRISGYGEINLESERQINLARSIAEIGSEDQMSRDAIALEATLTHIDSDTYQPEKLATQLAELSHFQGLRLALAAAFYDEDPIFSFRELNSAAISARLYETARALAKQWVFFAQNTSGISPIKTAAALFSRSRAEIEVAPGEAKASLVASLEQLHEAQRKGNKNATASRIVYPSDLAGAAWRSGKGTLAREFLTLAQIEIESVLSENHDEDTNHWIALALLNNAKSQLNFGKRETGFSLLEKAYTLVDQSGDANVGEKIAVFAATQQLEHGDTVNAKPWVDRVERYAINTDKKLSKATARRLSNSVEILRRMQNLLLSDAIDSAAKSNQSPLPSVGIFKVPSMPPLEISSDVDKWLLALSALPNDQRLAQMRVALQRVESDKIRLVPAKLGLLLVTAAYVEEDSGDDGAAALLIEKLDKIELVSATFDSDVRSPAAFLEGRIANRAGRHTLAISAFRWSLGLLDAKIVDMRLGLWHWIIQSQINLGQASAARESLEVLANLPVSPALLHARNLAAASVRGQLEMLAGRSDAALTALEGGIQEFAASPLPMPANQPLAIVMNLLSTSGATIDLRAVMLVLDQLVELHVTSCSGNLAAAANALQARRAVQDELTRRSMNISGSITPTEKLRIADTKQWGYDAAAELALRASGVGQIKLAQQMYEIIQEIQLSTLEAIPRPTSGEIKDGTLERMEASRNERLLMRMPPNKAAKLLASWSSSNPEFFPPKFYGSAADSPRGSIEVPESLIEFAVYRPIQRTTHCSFPLPDEPQLLSFVLKNGVLTKVLGGPLLKDLKADATQLRAQIASRTFVDCTSEARRLFNALLRDPLSILNPQEVLNVVPAAPLAHIPLGALQQLCVTPPSGAIALNLLPSGPMLSLLRFSKPSTAEATVISNPDYGSPMLGGHDFNQLKWSGKEGERVSSRIGANLFQGPNANIVALLASEKPRVLHIATHSYIQSESSTDTNKSETEASRPITVLDPALAVTGARIALANANEANEGVGQAGIVSAYLVSTLNLKGTSLVVFSSCSSGLASGQIGTVGIGLQTAAHLAGAKNVVTTLWQVDDEASVRFMDAFYEALARGVPPAVSLLQAQLSFRNDPKNTTLHAPYYWAGYVISGTNTPITTSSSSNKLVVN